MKILLSALALFTIAGCASLPGQTQSPAFVNGAMTAVVVVTYVKEYGCVPAGITAPLATACAPVTSTDPGVQQQAFLGCLFSGLMTAGGGLVKQCPTTTVPPLPPVVTPPSLTTPAPVVAVPPVAAPAK